jgi:hypothetical protein
MLQPLGRPRLWGYAGYREKKGLKNYIAQHNICTCTFFTRALSRIMPQKATFTILLLRRIHLTSHPVQSSVILAERCSMHVKALHVPWKYA